MARAVTAGSGVCMGRELGSDRDAKNHSELTPPTSITRKEKVQLEIQERAER